MGAMSINSFGRLLKMTSWGESHGPAIGVVVDGCPPGIPLDASDIQPWLDRRRTAQSRHMSQRKEKDQVQILSGLFEGKTTGTPISLLIPNEDAKSKDYDELADVFRPGHADFAYAMKYGHRDPRGGGRSSARETAARVAAGAIARLIIPEVRIEARLIEVGGVAIGRDEGWAGGELPDDWAHLLDAARKEGNSLGGIIQCVATGAPAGWGAPIYAKLDAELAGALMSVNAVKAVEIGAGLSSARRHGDENADAMRAGTDGPSWLSNHSGGILGGISTGAPIVTRAAFKPTPSIRMPLPSINSAGDNVTVSTKGRHDPCVALRAGPIVEAMTALVLADHKLLHRAQCGKA
jgi:chorismate synthase